MSPESFNTRYAAKHILNLPCVTVFGQNLWFLAENLQHVVFVYFHWNEINAIKKILQKPRQMVVWQYKIQTTVYAFKYSI